MSLVNKLLTDLEKQADEAGVGISDEEVLDGLKPASGASDRPYLKYHLNNLFLFLVVFLMLFAAIYGFYVYVEPEDTDFVHTVSSGPPQAVDRAQPLKNEDVAGQSVQAPNDRSGEKPTKIAAAEAPVDQVKTALVEPGPGGLNNEKEKQAAPVVPDKKVAMADTKKVSKPSVKSKPKQAAIKQRRLSPEQLAEQSYQKALRFKAQNRMVEMEITLNAALGHNPRHIAARGELIKTLSDSKRWMEALGTISTGLSYYPKHQEMLLWRAQILYEQGAQSEALYVLETLDYEEINSPEYLAFLGFLLQRDADYPDAVKAYRMALEKKPEEGRWWIGLGVSLESAQDQKAAEGAYVQALSDNKLASHLTQYAQQRLAILRD